MTRAGKIIAFIERYCVVPEGAHVGQPLKLADFQRKFIRDVYDNPAGTRRAYLSIARKNGKSGLIGALLLAHLVGPEAVQNSQIVSGAMSRDQAALVFNLASKMVQLSPRLVELVRIIPSSKRLIGLPRNVEFRALAADGKTAHGLSPVLAILDEVGQIRGPHSDFVDAITTSQGAHASPLLIAISTQAASDADLFSLWLDDAARSDDPRIVSHVYSAPDDCSLDDEDAWRAANPALGLFRSMDDMREQAKQAARMPSVENSFRNLLLNQRVSVHSPFVSPGVWRECGGEPVAFVGPVYGGLDLSARTDLTAFVLYDHAGNVRPYFWTPEIGLADRAARDRAPYLEWRKQGFLRTTPGASVDYAHVAAEIIDIIADVDLQAIAFDRWRIDVLRKEFDRLGVELPLVDWGQGFASMSPAVDSLEAELLNGRIRHGMHPVLTMCAANAVMTKDPAGSRKFDKAKATGRIDGLQALAMAVGVAGKTADPVTMPDDLVLMI
ncbi:terminase TerL endonuclease subunit [uncultured Luteimonas sp.]|uniref:terminase large subunit n=1 Tax=uncultured Luteimonas sp. TaxID=453144 RepID=UPI002637F804|nr:terminase TerL endonuclease subunit [uncultured Luteimonas sp.]